MRKGLLLFLSLALILTGCAGMSRTEQGTAAGVGIGAATGAILGQAIGHNTESTVLGAVAGAAVGGIAGNMIGQYMDKQERDLQRAVQRTQGARVERQQDVIFVTFKSDVLFDVDSTQLKRGAYDEIDSVADILVKYPETRVKVNGYTDSTGSEQYNLQLSDDRALAVKEALLDRGVHSSRISARGFGETKPIASNATESGRQLNRRVTIEIIPIKS